MLRLRHQNRADPARVLSRLLREEEATGPLGGYACAQSVRTLARVRWSLARKVDPGLRDWWPVVLVAGLSQVRAGDPGLLTLPPLVPVMVGLAVALPLRWRRERPVAVLVAISAVVGLFAVAFPADPPFATFAALMLGCYSLAQHAPARARLAGPLAPAAVMGLVFQGSGARAEELVFPLFYFGAAWGVGRVVGHRQTLAARLAGLVDALERERDEKATLAAEAERNRIAREVHDVVAHSLGVILIHAEAADELLTRGGSDVRRQLSVIESTAREALEEIRGVLGAVRAEGSPVPSTLEGLPALINRFHQAGVDVSLELCQAPGTLPPPAAVEATVYRLVQEALTNVLRHARGASASVHVHQDHAAVHVTIRDDGAGSRTGDVARKTSAGGYGLAGMRERVARLGGQLVTGEAEGGGFGIEAHLPLAAVPT